MCNMSKDVKFKQRYAGDKIEGLSEKVKYPHLGSQFETQSGERKKRREKDIF